MLYLELGYFLLSSSRICFAISVPLNIFAIIVLCSCLSGCPVLSRRISGHSLPSYGTLAYIMQAAHSAGITSISIRRKAGSDEVPGINEIEPAQGQINLAPV